MDSGIIWSLRVAHVYDVGVARVCDVRFAASMCCKTVVPKQAPTSLCAARRQLSSDSLLGKSGMPEQIWIVDSIDGLDSLWIKPVDSVQRLGV